MSGTEKAINPEQEYNIETEQKYIIEAIEHDMSLDRERRQTGMSGSVWFYPNKAEFLFEDRFVNTDAIKPLIDSKKLVYKGIGTHQGEKMPRYGLQISNI